jgi:hypothetical protein
VEAIAKTKAQDSANRERALARANAALETTTDQVQQTPAPSPIASPDFRQPTTSTTGANIILDLLIDTGLSNDVSLSGQRQIAAPRRVLDINVHVNVMR